MIPTDPRSAGVGPLPGADDEEEDESIHSDGSLFEDTSWGGAAGGCT